MEKLFLGKYFPPSKTQHFRTKITTFKQAEGESLTEAWDRWAELQRLCPNHGLDMWLFFQFFYGSCTIATKTHLNSATWGNMSQMDSAQAMAMIEDMAINQREWTAKRGGRVQSTPGIMKVDEVTALRAQIEALQHQMAQMQNAKSVTKRAPCGICGEETHITADCQVLTEGDEVEQASAMFYNQGDVRNDPIYNKVRKNDNINSNSYNPNTRWNHPNFKWRTENDNSNQFQGNSNQYRSNQNSYQGPSQNSNLEKMIQDLMTQQGDFINYQRNTNTDVSNSLRDINNRFDLLETKTKMLETQIAQQASSSSRQQGTLSGKPDINPREYANTITLRSGTGYKGPNMPSIEEKE